ncbi:MAG TPA: hypothetical protein VLA02_02320, partial [Reyranella sp.]|nr:hypothetical protein [Reyranella sp.]
FLFVAPKKPQRTASRFLDFRLDRPGGTEMPRFPAALHGQWTVNIAAFPAAFSGAIARNREIAPLSLSCRLRRNRSRVCPLNHPTTAALPLAGRAAMRRRRFGAVFGRFRRLGTARLSEKPVAARFSPTGARADR